MWWPQPIYFGDPFLIRLNPDEQLAEVKSRIQRQLGVPDAEFATWKFAVGSLDKANGTPDYIEDDDCIIDSWLKRPAINNHGTRPEGSFLGLEHADPNPRRNYHNSLRSVYTGCTRSAHMLAVIWKLPFYAWSGRSSSPISDTTPQRVHLL